MLGVWFLLDNVLPASMLLGIDRHGGTAFWAHIAGFLAGAVLVLPFRDEDLVNEHRLGARNWREQRVALG
jgi:membrane associated rhomboid family serine protease